MEINDDFIDFIESKLNKGIYSKLFISQLIAIDNNQSFYLGKTDFSEFRLFTIMDTISFLEGKSPTTCTKKEKKLRGKLSEYYHKHIHYPRSIDHIVSNTLRNENLINEAMKKAIKFKKDNKHKEPAISFLSYYLVTDRISEVYMRRKVTGEWLIYKKLEDKNIYLTLASHTENDDEILERIRSCEEYISY